MLPHFMVIGAQKSGTSSLCSFLKAHKDIFMCHPDEPFFFDRDDFIAHPYFYVESKKEWMAFNWSNNKHILLKNYERLFDSADKNMIVGEGSTTYLASEKAAARISEELPNIKLIIILRDPVKRAYSAYWHYLSTGRFIFNFENQIKFEPLAILNRGLYKEQIRMYLNKFSRDQLHIIVFEDFIKNLQQNMDTVFDFLGVDKGLNISNIILDKNTARIPKYYHLQLFLNMIARNLKLKMDNYIPGNVETNSRKITYSKLLRRIRMWNCNKKLQYPPMDNNVRTMLEEFYKRENEGLSDLIGVDLSNYWTSI